MKKAQRSPKIGTGLLLVLIVISVFALGYYTEGRITGKAVEGMETVTGEMVGVSGMAVQDYLADIRAAYEKYPALKEYPGIIEKIMYIESGGRNIKGDDGQSIGPMQIFIRDASSYGYSEYELKDPSKNIDAGAQKINNMISHQNFQNDERQLILGYNQNNVPTIQAVRSGDGNKIYPNYYPANERQNLVTSRLSKVSIETKEAKKQTWIFNAPSLEKPVQYELNEGLNEDEAKRAYAEYLNSEDSDIDIEFMVSQLTAKKGKVSISGSHLTPHTALVENNKGEEIPYTFPVPAGEDPMAVLEIHLAIKNLYRDKSTGQDWDIAVAPEPTVSTKFESRDPSTDLIYFQGSNQGIKPTRVIDSNNYEVEINYETYRVNTQTGAVVPIRLPTDNQGKVDLNALSDMNIREGIGNTLYFYKDNKKVASANYNSNTKTYKIEGSNEEVVYWSGNLYPTEYLDATLSNEYYGLRIDNAGKYEPLWVKEGSYYTREIVLRWDRQKNGYIPSFSIKPIPNEKILKNPAPAGNVMVSEVYKTDKDGKILQEAIARRVHDKRGVFIDLSEETYKELGIKEDDKIIIRNNEEMEITGKDGNTKNINKKGVNEEIETKEGDITTKTTYNTETKSKTIEK
ncbi:lytic transglycosylase domain-containing protein, partial [Candidatus Woesearchaeota archaeon]|nr:lytic transglycosylase domain-containing protein [Candidatus Woesearchaeota archaeon]